MGADVSVITHKQATTAHIGLSGVAGGYREGLGPDICQILSIDRFIDDWRVISALESIAYLGSCDDVLKAASRVAVDCPSAIAIDPLAEGRGAVFVRWTALDKAVACSLRVCGYWDDWSAAVKHCAALASRQT